MRKNNRKDVSDKNSNPLKRVSNDDEIEEEGSELMNSKKRAMISEKGQQKPESPEKFDYEESFRRHLLKEAELQKNIEFFHRNIGEKILYDQNFSEMLLEMAIFLETNNEDNLTNYKRLFRQNQEFLNDKSKESFIKQGDTTKEIETNFKDFIENKRKEFESEESRLQGQIKVLEKSLKDELEIMENKENEIEIYKEMTGFSLELKEATEKEEVYLCQINSFSNKEKFLKFELRMLPSNEIQYVPVEIGIDIQENHELEDEMFFDASQTDHFMALIYKIANRDLIS